MNNMITSSSTFLVEIENVQQRVGYTPSSYGYADYSIVVRGAKNGIDKVIITSVATGNVFEFLFGDEAIYTYRYIWCTYSPSSAGFHVYDF